MVVLLDSQGQPYTVSGPGDAAGAAAVAVELRDASGNIVEYASSLLRPDANALCILHACKKSRLQQLWLKEHGLFWIAMRWCHRHLAQHQ